MSNSAYAEQHAASQSTHFRSSRPKLGVKSQRRDPGKARAGHEFVLEKCRREGRLLQVVLMNDEKFSGRVKSFDKYTITVSDGKNEVTLFKHGIMAFGILGKEEANEEGQE